MAFRNKILPYYTYDDYCRWKGRWEIIDGIPYSMNSILSPEHQKITGNISSEIRTALKEKNCSCKVYQPIDYKVSEDTVLNPDLLVVCKEIKKAFLDFAPEMVVEILSPATALKDRHTKLEIYQSQKIPYYLIVDVDIKTIEVFELKEEKYKATLPDQKKPFELHINNCDFSLIFKNIWS